MPKPCLLVGGTLYVNNPTLYNLIFLQNEKKSINQYFMYIFVMQWMKP